MSVILSAASCIDWAARLCGLASAGALFELAESRNRPADQRIVSPVFIRRANPAQRSARARRAVRLEPRERRGSSCAQAVLEGVAFAFRDGFDALLASGARIDSIAVIGGGARSAYWGRILSAALRRR
jgi:xylulokinase